MFYGITVIRSHVKIHLVERELFPCDFPGCTKQMTSMFLLQNHKRVVHEKVREFQCHCGKTFQYKRQLCSHQRHFHDKIKDHRCDICGKMFAQLPKLKLHMATIHAPEGHKPVFTCEICAAKFTESHTLKYHMKKHKEPQFNCQSCDKKFHYRRKLLDHQEHHETLAFPCEHCRRSFTTENKLHRHYKKSHFKDKTTYRCELCSSTFTRRTTYRDHVIRQHKDLDVNIKKDLLERISKMLSEEKVHEMASFT